MEAGILSGGDWVKTLVVFLEEPSAEWMVRAVLPRVLPSDCILKCFHFEGKQDLEKNIERKIRGWRTPNSYFLVMRDRDSEDCRVVKRRLAEKCRRAGRPDALVRIACGELESFYLGDLGAVSVALSCKVPSSQVAKFRDPDALYNAAEELERLTGKQYQKISGSKAIAPHLKVDGSNRSRSFNVLLEGVRKLLA